MKTTITNKHNKKIVVEIHAVKRSNELAIVMHGLGGKKEELHIKALAESFAITPISTVISSSMSLKAPYNKVLEKWKAES